MKLGNAHLQATNDAETERFPVNHASTKNKQLLQQAKRDIEAMNEKSNALQEKLAKVKEYAKKNNQTKSLASTQQSVLNDSKQFQWLYADKEEK